MQLSLLKPLFFNSGVPGANTKELAAPKFAKILSNLKLI
jgi:hypothetical protein